MSPTFRACATGSMGCTMESAVVSPDLWEEGQEFVLGSVDFEIDHRGKSGSQSGPPTLAQ